MSTPIEQLQSGILSRADQRALRKVIGAETFAEWIEGDQSRPYRVRDKRLLAVMALRQRAISEARMWARTAPWVLIPQVRR
jgi:hypothetical protein